MMTRSICRSSKMSRSIIRILRHVFQINQERILTAKMWGTWSRKLTIPISTNQNYSKDPNKYVDVLWIQTADMVSMLKTEKPRLFQCDTTFGEIIYFSPECQIMQLQPPNVYFKLVCQIPHLGPPIILSVPNTVYWATTQCAK